MKLAPEFIENSFGTYIRGKANTVPYFELLQKVDEYKKNVCQRFIPLRYEKMPTIKGEQLHASVKVDGEYCLFYYNAQAEDSFFCNSPTHRVYMGLPVNEDLNSLMKKHNIQSIILGGELCATTHDPPEFNARMRVYDLMHYTRDPQSQKDIEKIGFKIFDLLELNGEEWLFKSFKERVEKIQSLFTDSGRASMVVSRMIQNSQELKAFYEDKVLKNGHEGIVVRSEGVGFKIKPVHTIDVAIIGISGGRSGTRIAKNQLASSLVALRKPDGDYHILTRVGGGLTDDQRAELWKTFTVVKSEGFLAPTRSDGRVFQMVKPEVVAQIDYLDVLTDRNGEPIYQNVVRYNQSENTWEYVASEPFVALISPRFIQGDPIRADKQVETITDVRKSQLTEMVEIPTASLITPEMELEESKVLARKVYEQKDTMVRKFMAWQTNKSKTGEYPEYIVYQVDYSQKRKDPLKRVMKFSNDEDQMWHLFDKLVHDEMIGSTGSLKRGWKEFSIMDSRITI
jgi:hypothetical protein